jgi:putative transposase
VFGCARVVYNDALRERERAHATGERLTDTEVQRRVIALAKTTPQRAWLGEVASVALVQACQDERRAYPNWFDSLSGTRRGRRAGHPRFRSKHGRQSIRLTRNGFALHGARLYVAKVGDLKVRWSRPLPSTPSSVTVIRDPDGRFHASFVVQRASTPLPAIDRTAGIDLGLSVFATVAASDGTTEQVANPRHLPVAQRRLTRAQRALARKQKGSKNRHKARYRVAVAHRKVRDRRADHHHKLALRLVREDQAVAVEDLGITGPGRGWREASRRRLGNLPAPAGPQGHPVRPPPGEGRPLGANLADLLGVRTPRRPQAAVGAQLGLPGVRSRPRPGRQRGPQHSGHLGRRRAGGDPKRLWSRCQTASDGGGRH